MEVMQLPGNSLTVLPLIDKVQLNGEILFGLFRKPRILEAWEQPGNAVHQQLKVKLTNDDELMLNVLRCHLTY